MKSASDLSVTIELKVHIRLFWLSFQLGGICNLRFELSQFRGHNGFHPVRRFSCFEKRINNGFVPVSCCAPPRPPHYQRIRFVHADSGQVMVTIQRVQSPNPPIASTLFPLAVPSQLRLQTAMPKPPIGPSRLSQILKKLKADPKPILTPSLKSLKLTYAARNDHFGARCVCHFPNDSVSLSLYAYSDLLCDVLVANCRHFVREELPRIQYANPTMAIEVSRVPKLETDTWQSSLFMEFGRPPNSTS